MKTSIAALVAFAALASVPVAAAAVRDVPAKTKTSASPADLRGRFNTLVDELARKAAARSATREDFNRVVEEIRSVANEYMGIRRVEIIRDRMIERMNELEVRARDAQLMLMEFDAFKDLLIDIELEGCLRRMAENVRAGKSTRLEYAMVYEALTQRAESAKDWNPEIDAIIGRLRAECERLEKRMKEAVGEKELVPLMELQGDVMAHAAMVRLGKRALKLKPGIIVPHDYTDVMEALSAYGVSETSDLGRKVNARLEEIRSAVVGGRITRSDFDALQTLLKQRARAAAGGV